MKLFYENLAEDEINHEIIEEFRRRYAEKGRFTDVRKQAIHSEFWSFLGNYGAGHANIRVVSISKYMVEAFRELDRLHELDYFFPEKLKRQIEQDFRWKRYSTEKGTYDNIPSYTDMGFLVVRLDLLDKFFQVVIEPVQIEISTESQVKEYNQRGLQITLERLIDVGLFEEAGHSKLLKLKGELSWQSLSKFAALLKEAFSNFQISAPYVFAMPRLYIQTEFMAFFFEILWSKGGDIYHFPIFSAPNGKTRMAFYKEQILSNKYVWEEFTRIIKEAIKYAKDKKKWIYEIEKMRERVKPLADFFIKEYQTKFVKDGENDEQFKQKYGNLINDGENTEIYLNEFIELILDLMNSDESLFPIDDDDIIIINNKFAKEALEFIYDLVFDSGGSIPNPHSGDFSDNSIFCRKWYSQIEDVRQKITKDHKKSKVITDVLQELKNKIEDITVVDELLKEIIDKPRKIELKYFEENALCVRALPYFTEPDGHRKKSCTAETVWCLGLIKEALSPEIGWIFIDTLTSTEWVENRAAKRHGFPHRFEEMKSMEHYDPELYKILQEIIKNKQVKEQIYDAKSKLVLPKEENEESKKDFETWMKNFFDGEYHDRDVGEVLKYMSRNKKLANRKEIFIKELSKRNVRIPNVDNERVSELSDFEKNLTLRSKIQAHRPFFHRVESILHEEIVKLFSPEGRRYWYRTLIEPYDIGKSDEKIDEALGRLRKREKNAQKEGYECGDGLIENVLQQMHDRLIFDLLTALPEEIQKLWSRIGSKAHADRK